MGKYRVLIADDRPGLTERITATLPNQFEVLASLKTTNRAPLCRTALKRKPDVVLIGTAAPTRTYSKPFKKLFEYCRRCESSSTPSRMVADRSLTTK